MLTSKLAKKIVQRKEVLGKLGQTKDAELGLGHAEKAGTYKNWSMSKTDNGYTAWENDSHSFLKAESLEQLKKKIDDYKKGIYPKMKAGDSKVKDTAMECMECGKKFNKNITSSTAEVKCPACGGYDTEVTGDSKSKDAEPGDVLENYHGFEIRQGKGQGVEVYMNGGPVMQSASMNEAKKDIDDYRNDRRSSFQANVKKMGDRKVKDDQPIQVNGREVDIMDGTHFRVRPIGSERWSSAMHIAQAPDDLIEKKWERSQKTLEAQVRVEIFSLRTPGQRMDALESNALGRMEM